MNIWPFRISPEIQVVLDVIERVDEWEFNRGMFDEVKHRPSGLVFIRYSGSWHTSASSKLHFFPKGYEAKRINKDIDKLLHRMTANALAKKESDHA